MNPNWPAVDNWLDLIGNVWIGLVLIAAAAVPSWFAARNHKSLNEVRDQVKNGHTTPLRVDLDKALYAIESLAHDVRGLRSDLASEEDRRRQQYGELRSDLDERIGRHRKLED